MPPTDDPLLAINDYGSYERAIELLSERIALGCAASTDFELLAYALRSAGRPAEAAEHYRNALHAEPNHARALNWTRHIQDCERTARNGAHLPRPHGITVEQLTGNSHLTAGAESLGWVLDNSGWIQPNGHIPPKSLGNRVMNKLYAFAFDMLPPLGRLVNLFVRERANSTGRWTGLPDWAKGLLRLADLAAGRDWMMDHARLPPGVTSAERDMGPEFAPHAFSPDGRGNNPHYRNVGGVGTAVPFTAWRKTTRQETGRMIPACRPRRSWPGISAIETARSMKPPRPAPTSGGICNCLSTT